MPLYDYGCKACGHEFSESQRIDDRKVPVERGCPECGADEMYQMLGSPRICYSLTTRRTDDDFNSKLKELRNKVPERYRENLDRNIR